MTITNFISSSWLSKLVFFLNVPYLSYTTFPILIMEHKFSYLVTSTSINSVWTVDLQLYITTLLYVVIYYHHHCSQNNNTFMTSMFPTDFIYVMFSLVHCTAGKSQPQKLNVTVKQSRLAMKRVSVILKENRH